MPATNQHLENKVNKLQDRVSELTDEVVLLKRDLNKTRELIQQDMNKVVNKLKSL